MPKGILFISDMCNHQCTHLQKLATDTDTTFNMIHYFNWTMKHHTTITVWRIWNKVIITLCDESKVKLRVQLGQWTIDDNKYIKT